MTPREPDTNRLQAYRSHKIVHAGKITGVFPDTSTDGAILAVSAFGEEVRVLVPLAYLVKHDPKVGGYYVEYSDGYASWSPAEAFESGYDQLTGVASAAV